jgi:hypothetical protein
VERAATSGTAGESQEVHFQTQSIRHNTTDDRKSISTDSQAMPSISSTSGPTDAEKYYGVKYLRSKGWSKTAIIKEIWGKTGRNYEAVSAAYEAIMRQLEQDEAKQ